MPGTAAGLALALEKYGSGKFTLAELLKPAIELARDGFIIADDIADTLPDGRAAAGALAVVGTRYFPAPTARRCAKATGWFKPIWRQRSRRSPNRGRADFTRARSRKNW